jgi:glycosyltransferase involved in cell wall biosynthesis
MRIAYFTLPALLDVSLSYTQAIASKLEFHMVMQITNNSWRSSLFENKPQDIPPGLSNAYPVLDNFPNPLKETWKDAASFQLAAFPGKSGLNPRSIKTGFAILKWLKELKPDLIHFETTSGRLLWAQVFLRRIAPLVLTVHDPQPHTGESPLKKRVIRRFTYSLANQFIFHNRIQIPQFCKDYGISDEKIEFTPLGEYALYRFYLEELRPVDRKMVLFFGRLSPYKGIETLLQSAPMICKKVSDAHFVIAGRPIPGYKLPPLPRLSNGGKFTIIEEYIPNTRLAELFQQTAVVVCPYIDATQSGVVMTAYAFWKPVVATRVGGLPEYIDDGKTGILVEPKNPESLSEGTIKILNKMKTIEGQQRISNTILKKSQTEFNWDKIAAQTIEIYQRTINHSIRR